MALTVEPQTLNNSPILTIGPGSGPFRGMANCSASQPLNVILDEAQNYYSQIVLLRGTYQIKNPATITQSGMAIRGSRGTVVNCTGTGTVGAIDVAQGVEGVAIEGIEWQVPTPVSGQSLLRFGATGADHRVVRNKFYIHPSTTYDDISLAAPMRLVDMQNVIGKEVCDNTFLPYTDVIPIWLENGNAGMIARNRVHNGLAVDLDSLVGAFQFFPFVRPCKVGVYMLNERHGWVSHNYFWGMGNPTDSGGGKAVDAAIQYVYNKNYGVGTGECGHMEISDNQLELVHSAKQIWLQGLSYSNIRGNNIGVSAANASMLANGAGKGGIILEPGIVNDGTDKSKWCVVRNNNLHNTAKQNTDAAGVALTGVDNISVSSNECLNLFGRCAVYVGAASTNVTVRGLVADFNTGTPTIPNNNFAVRVTGAGTDKITVGEITGQGVDSQSGSSANQLVDTTGFVGSQICIGGLGKIGSGAYTAPTNTDTPDLISTNIRVST